MALPVIKTLSETVDLEKTVYPYLPQLYDLPQQIIQTITNLRGLQILYVSTNPLVSAVAFSLALFPIFLVVSEINKNYSQVDRLWSILPTVYIVHFAAYAHAVGLQAERLDLAAAVSTLWSTRLTFNYWRKGGYQVGSEDYRWEIIKKNVGGFLFFIFNVLFISSGQSVLLASVSFPVYALLLSTRLTGGGLTNTDIGFGAGIALLVVTEFIADGQQWNYQNAKKEYQKTAKVPKGWKREDLDRGFITHGLWAYSRHPNFAAEQGVWLSYFLWACQISETSYNWTGVGALGYLILFQASTWFTELVSAGKYQEYRSYQKQVGMFVPTPGTGWSPVEKSQEKAKELKKSK